MVASPQNVAGLLARPATLTALSKLRPALLRFPEFICLVLAQVAAEAAEGEFDHLGDPADLRDLVSSDSVLTDASGFSAGHPPLSGPMMGGGGQFIGGYGSGPAVSMAALSGAPGTYGGVPSLHLSGPGSELAAMDTFIGGLEHGGASAPDIMSRSSTMVPPAVHTTQVRCAVPHITGMPCWVPMSRLVPYAATALCVRGYSCTFEVALLVLAVTQTPVS